MAYELSQAVKATFVANSDLSDNQYEFVQIANGNIAAEGSKEGFVDLAFDHSKVIGVLQNAPKAGQEAEVVLVGITKVKTGADLTSIIRAGDRIVAADKFADPMTTTPTSVVAQANNGAGWVVGRALTKAASGELATIVLSTPAANYFVD